MNYWIFQGNPDVFDIDTYLANNDTIVWSVRQKHFANEMAVGDEVYLWRSAGSRKAKPGVVAKGRITEPPRMRPDDVIAERLWHTSDPGKNELRVAIRLKHRCLGAKEVIKSDWIQVDPILHGLRIHRLRNETNYRIRPAEAMRLAMLCRTVGYDWSYEESLAGLWAFKQTEGKSVSKAADGAVARIALLIGRPLSGVYNKVMNFRHLDPRDERKGLANINQIDRVVWDEFYDQEAKEIDADRLDRALSDAWHVSASDLLASIGASEAAGAVTSLEEDTRIDRRERAPSEAHRRAFLAGWTSGASGRLYGTVTSRKTHANMGNLFGWIFGEQPQHFKLASWHLYVERTARAIEKTRL